MTHNWPKDPEEHVWGPWMIHTGVKPGVRPVQYRSCIHPICNAVEYREAPKV